MPTLIAVRVAGAAKRMLRKTVGGIVACYWESVLCTGGRCYLIRGLRVVLQR